MALQPLSSAVGKASSTWTSCTKRWPIRSPSGRNWKPSPLNSRRDLGQILGRLLMKVGRDALHRNCQFAVQAFGSEGKRSLASQLSGNTAFDEFGAEPALLRFDNRWPAPFQPLDAQDLPVVV